MWCKKIRQERANWAGTKANVFPVVITHPEKMVSVGGSYRDTDLWCIIMLLD